MVSLCPLDKKRAVPAMTSRWRYGIGNEPQRGSGSDEGRAGMRWFEGGEPAETGLNTEGEEGRRGPRQKRTLTGKREAAGAGQYVIIKARHERQREAEGLPGGSGVTDPRQRQAGLLLPGRLQVPAPPLPQAWTRSPLPATSFLLLAFSVFLCEFLTPVSVLLIDGGQVVG